MNSIRALYDEILHYPEFLPENLLEQWIQDNAYTQYIQKLTQHFIKHKERSLPVEDLWEVYALTRVLDILTLRFQPNHRADESDFLGPQIADIEYIRFLDNLGVDLKFPDRFHPFFCEILEAIPGEEDFALQQCIFPAVCLNQALIKRAGVRITLNPDHYSVDFINRARLYWAFRRKNRYFEDLSHGWGHNSQWRTEARIDLALDTTFVYNSNGDFPLTQETSKQKKAFAENQLRHQEAIDLVRFRHLLHPGPANDDAFPYAFTYIEEKS